jgi:hypothetical protein
MSTEEKDVGTIHRLIPKEAKEHGVVDDVHYTPRMLIQFLLDNIDKIRSVSIVLTWENDRIQPIHTSQTRSERMAANMVLLAQNVGDVLGSMEDMSESE